MTAKIPKARKHTARETAEALGISERYVRTLQAQPRDQYLRNSHLRAKKILALRSKGLLWREVAQRVGISENAARTAGYRAHQQAKETV